MPSQLIGRAEGLRLIAQGVYAPTAFTGTAGKAAAMKIEQQLAYAERQRVGTRRVVDPIVVRERPTNQLVSDSAQMPTDDQLRVRDPTKLPYRAMRALFADYSNELV